MTSLVHRAAMFSLLLICGPALYQASSSCPMLDIVSLVTGTFRTVREDGRTVDITIRPIHNPALNQYYPLYHVGTVDDQPYMTGIFLFAEGSHTNYTVHSYFFDTLPSNGTFEEYYSTITRDDLPKFANCTENGVLTGDRIDGFISCFMKGVVAVADFDHTCSQWMLLTRHPGLSPSEVEESEFEEVPTYNDRVKGYPFPASWLEGHEDYEYLCPAS